MKAVRQASAARGVREQPAAVVADQLERARLPGVDRVVGGFERQHQQRIAAVVDAVGAALLGVDQAQVRRVEPGLRDRAHRARAGQEIVERERRAGAEASAGPAAASRPR